MVKNKKSLKLCIITMMMCLCVVLANAEPRHGEDKPRQFGPDAMFAWIADDLKLSDEQRVQYDRITAELKEVKKNMYVKKLEEFKSFIGLVNKGNVTDADIDAIQKEIDVKKEEHKKLKEEIASKANELKILTLSLTDEELKAKIKEIKKELSKMKIKVDDIKENKIDPIPPEKMSEAKENFEKELKIFKKTKKICVEIINDISDGLELKIKDTYNKIGIENDDELIKQLNIDQNLINGK